MLIDERIILPNRSVLNPVKNFAEIFNEMSRAADDVLHYFGYPSFGEDNVPDFVPGMNLVENEKSYEVSIDIPGINKEDVEISIDGNTLIITGERKKKELEEGSNLIFNESMIGKFRREIVLSDVLDQDNIEAKYELGTLVINIPKKVKDNNKKLIEIKEY